MKRYILTKLTKSKHFRKLDAGEEAKVRSGHETTDWLQIGKAVRQGCVWSPCLFDVYAEHIMRNSGLKDAQAEIKIAGRNNNNVRHADDNTLVAESEEELKGLLMTLQEESEKVGLNLNVQNTKNMAIWSHYSMGNRRGNSDWLKFGGVLKTLQMFIAALKLKSINPWKESYEQARDHNKKQSQYSANHLVKLCFFFFFSSSFMYGCESWNVKKAEHQRIEPLGLQYWRRLLRVLWTASRSKQSILKEISPGLSLKDWCWSWNSNTVATSCEALTDWKRPWCWERPRAGGEGDYRRWDGWMAWLTWWTWVWGNSGRWWWIGSPEVLRFMGS